MTAINSVVKNQGEFVEVFRENVIQVIGRYATMTGTTEYDEQIEILQNNMLELIESNADSGIVDEDFDEQYQKIAEQIKEFKQKKLEFQREQNRATTVCQQLSDMDSCLNKTSYRVLEFDDDLIRRLLQTVKVLDENTLEMQFKSGIVMKQSIPYCD